MLLEVFAQETFVADFIRFDRQPLLMSEN